MTTLETSTLWVHIAAGVVALLAGIVALVTTKGGTRHRRAGQFYVISMGVVVGTVLPLLAFDPSPNRIFLTLVAIFSGYFAFSGYRVLSRKRPIDAAEPLDWGAAILVVGACLFLGGWGLGFLLGGDSFGTVMVVFGAIGLLVGITDIQVFRIPDKRAPWMPDHLGRMMGAYIATVTAVSVVNLSVVSPVVSWLWPTAIGVPLIWYWQRKYANTGLFARLVPKA
jgi:uncharacterized membrane protein